MSRRASRLRAYAPDPAAPGHACESPGCTQPGQYRAPRSRSDLRNYVWLCLDHVRAYNASWDYYKGMSPGDIERELRADTAWQRPTWPLGRLGARTMEEALRDQPLRDLRGGPAHHRRHLDLAPIELREPLKTLGLEWPVTLTEVKARYKELAKRHHPDANGGDRAAEERLKTINLAYAVLKSRLPPDSRLAAAG